MQQVAIFDDVVFARGEVFHIPGLEVAVFAHADNAVQDCAASRFDVVFMDYAMGPGRQSGAEAIRAMRLAGFAGRVIAISSDPAANAEMCSAGADESLGKKAHLRSFLVHLAKLGGGAVTPAPRSGG